MRPIIRAIAGKTIAAIILSGALAGLGAGVAEAKPMDRQHAKYCAKIRSDEDYTRKAFIKAYDKYGANNMVTLQAASNYERAHNKLVSSGC